MKNNNSSASPHLAKKYDAAFFDGLETGSVKSARKYADVLSSLISPRSVIDVGCGTGAWLLAFKEGGATELVGLDGDWVHEGELLDRDIRFIACDLNERQQLPTSVRADLAMSLEVAEHLEESSADSFVHTLTDFSDVVLFSAAYSGQGGTNHINEQPHTYWAQKFGSRGYVPFDIFRARFWADASIDWWYRQNVFLYVKSGSDAHVMLTSKGYAPMTEISFMDCVHPELLMRDRDASKQFLSRPVRSFVPRPVKSVARGVRNILLRFTASR